MLSNIHWTIFFKRFCAYIIDIIFVSIIVHLLDKVFVMTDTLPALDIRYILYYFIGVMYFALQESSAYQATLGKRLLNLSVCNLDGERISLVRAIARNILRILNWLIFSIGYLFILFTKKEQGLHDLIAKTLVIDESEYEEEYEEED